MQVNPHFLFNSFNTLIAIIEKDKDIGFIRWLKFECGCRICTDDSHCCGSHLVEFCKEHDKEVKDSEGE